jgi:hypothetical protein
MEVTIHIPDELAAAARSRGVEPQDYVEELLADYLRDEGSDEAPLRTPEQIDSWINALAQFSDHVSPLPDVITREWICQDHD